MKLREAFELALAENHFSKDQYQRTFELMHGRVPSNDERDMIKRRCIWYEKDQTPTSARLDHLAGALPFVQIASTHRTKP